MGVPQSFFTVHNECEPHITQVQKIETSFEIPFPLSRRSDRSDPVVGHFLTSLSYTFEGPGMYDLIITFVFILYILVRSVSAFRVLCTTCITGKHFYKKFDEIVVLDV